MTLEDFHKKCFNSDEYICDGCPFGKECQEFFKGGIRDLLDEIKDGGIEV